MATTSYFLSFGSGNPSAHTGLSPTFIVFRNPAGGATTSPAITEVASTGIYTFSYDPLGPIAFVIDGATTGLASNIRYITNALAQDLLGNTTSSYGTSAADPTSVFGFLKRSQEIAEGNSVYTKATGIWDLSSRGSSTLLRSKTITDSATEVEKV